jgi:hypothetical protein
MQAIIVKQWCDENITHVAWKRITMKLFPHFCELGVSILDLEIVKPSLILSRDTISLIEKTIQEMYQIEIFMTK